MSKYYFGDAGGVARKINKVYFGVEMQVPVYSETSATVTETLTTANYDSFFEVETGSTSATKWTFISGAETGIKLKSGSNSSDIAQITLTAKKRIHGVTIKNAATSSYGNYCSLAIGINGAWVSNVTKWNSGTEEFWSGTLNTGDSILLWCNMALDSAMNYYITIDSAAVGTVYTESVQTGTATKGIARLAPRAYYSVSGLAQYWWNGVLPATYTGEHTVSDVTLNGASYKLFKLTGDGTLTLCAAAQFWMCGGGASGQRATYANGRFTGGRGGGGGFITTGNLAAGTYTVAIGQGGAARTSGSSHNAGTATTITDGSTTHTAAGATNQDGASGGGGVGRSYNGSSSLSDVLSGGTGQGASTIPFGLSNLGKHCAGGAGGAANSNSGGTRYGGAGGSNGEGGASGSTSQPSTTTGYPAPGGDQGGGNGGGITGGAGSAATFYGSGGGGGGIYYPGSDTRYGDGGAGYQGVAYMLVPT